MISRFFFLVLNHIYVLFVRLGWMYSPSLGHDDPRKYKAKVGPDSVTWSKK